MTSIKIDDRLNFCTSPFLRIEKMCKTINIDPFLLKLQDVYRNMQEIEDKEKGNRWWTSNQNLMMEMKLQFKLMIIIN